MGRINCEDPMNFLIISQKCQFNSNYTLNNLTGHGRFDIICRSILASTRELQSDKGSSIFCYLKGGEEKGWLKILSSFVSRKVKSIIPLPN